MIDWNRPLVADVGEPLKVQGPVHDGHYLVEIYAGEGRWYDQNGELAFSASKEDSYKFTLRNRPWRVGDPVVTLGGDRSGVVCKVDQKGVLPVRVRFDDGATDWFTCSGLFVPGFDKDRRENIRYDYSRASKPKKKQEQDESYKPWSHYGYDPGTCEPHAELETLIAEAMDAHDAGRNHNATPDPDGPFTIRCNVAAIEMFAKERAKAIAKARAEALEEAAATIDGLRPAVEWSEQTADDWGCGCLDAARAIRHLANKDRAND